MGELRASIAANRVRSEVARRSRRARSRCSTRPKRALAPDQASSASTFLGAFTILLREGLEALLIVVAMLAFLARPTGPS